MAALILIGYTPPLVVYSIMSLMNCIVCFYVTWGPFFDQQNLLFKESDVRSVILYLNFKFQFLIVIDKYESKRIGSQKSYDKISDKCTSEQERMDGW